MTMWQTKFRNTVSPINNYPPPIFWIKSLFYSKPKDIAISNRTLQNLLTKKISYSLYMQACRKPSPSSSSVFFSAYLYIWSSHWLTFLPVQFQSSLTGISLLTADLLHISSCFPNSQEQIPSSSLSSGWPLCLSHTSDQLTLFFSLSTGWPVYMERQTFLFQDTYIDTYIHIYIPKVNTQPYTHTHTHIKLSVKFSRISISKLLLYCWSLYCLCCSGHSD